MRFIEVNYDRKKDINTSEEDLHRQKRKENKSSKMNWKNGRRRKLSSVQVKDQEKVLKEKVFKEAYLKLLAGCYGFVRYQ